MLKPLRSWSDRPIGRSSASSVARRFPDQAPSPSRSEQVTPLGVFFVQMHGVDDPVGSKAAKIPAQLAPCRQQPHGLEIANGDRPDGAFAVTAMFVAIAQRDLLSFVNLRPRSRHVDAVGFPAPARAGAAGGSKHKTRQAFRDRIADLSLHAPCRPSHPPLPSPPL